MLRIIVPLGAMDSTSLSAGSQIGLRLIWQPYRLTQTPSRQSEHAIFVKDLEKACCLLQSMLVHAAGDPEVGLCSHL